MASQKKCHLDQVIWPSPKVWGEKCSGGISSCKGMEALKRAKGLIIRYPRQRALTKLCRCLEIASRLSVLKIFVEIFGQIPTASDTVWSRAQTSITSIDFSLSSFLCCFNPILRPPVNARWLVPSSSNKFWVGVSLSTNSPLR